ncbi:zinc ribbon domain-containing protein [Okeania sp.]|uniref:zinc ribbon domain-containing protein n=1 Tax=Okeania sp. TaxID=3100323 RepID=UPI002B4AC169|nr:zinc ribbon domain-containing protein [Okeania sp.]MEB3339486.1 zinc ribbon domain-containing protein [Okeania sp.]
MGKPGFVCVVCPCFDIITNVDIKRELSRVDPKGTSQYCWQCLNKVSKSLSDPWHSCPRCGQELDRDYKSALLIQKIGLLSTQGEDITSLCQNCGQS